MTRISFLINNPQIMRPAPYQTMRPGMFSLPKGSNYPIYNYNFYGNMGGQDLWANYMNPEMNNYDKASEWAGIIGLGMGVLGQIIDIFKPSQTGDGQK